MRVGNEGGAGFVFFFCFFIFLNALTDLLYLHEDLRAIIYLRFKKEKIPKNIDTLKCFWVGIEFVIATNFRILV